MPTAVIPIATDQSARKTPLVTMFLVAANALAYLWMLAAARGSDDALPAFVMRWGLSRAAFEPWQPITYQFVHDPGTIWHILGNMVFLWTFGSAVESRMGRPGFLVFYLAGGAVAGLVQIATSAGPVIGASGSVSAVTGAFIALFPRARVAVLFLFSVMPVPAMLLVALYFLADLLGAFGAGRGGVGHVAHLAGTAFGLAVTLALLGLGAIKRTDMDLLFLVRQWRRRREMRKALDGSRGHAGPWESAGATGGNVTNAKAAIDAPSPKALARQADRAREAANAAFARGDFAAAAAGYERALELDPGAATSDETRLMLAVIHVRRIPDRAKAVAMLDAVGAALPAHLRELQAALRAELPG
jgi:membrane associated rhomboid family serine protease